MSCTGLVKELQNATTITTLVASDEFAIIRNSTAYKITEANLVKSIGVTGQIKTTGSSSAVPILTKPSSALNYIAGIEPGPGVTAQTSPQGGVKVSANIGNAVISGAGLLKNETDAKLRLKRLVQGNGIDIVEGDNSITISQVTGTTSSKTVVVNSVSDFPAAISGVISLADDTDYLLATDISTSNRFTVGKRTTLRGASSQIVKLTYTGVGTMLTGVDPNFRTEKITLSCPNGQLFDVTSPAGTGVFQMIEMNVESCDSVGSASDLFLLRLFAVAWEDVTTDGVSFSGAFKTFSADIGLFVNVNAGTCFNLGSATFQSFSVSNQTVLASAAGTKFIDGSASSANIVSGELGTVFNTKISGGMTPLTTINEDDARWNFLLNDQISDTRPDGLLSLDSSSTTTIVTVSTPVKVNGIFTVQRASQMTGTTGGRLTYDGEKAATLPITATVSIEPSSGTNKIINLYFAKNGSVVTASMVTVVASSGTPRNVNVTWQDSFVNDDYYELWVENATDDIDVNVDTAVLRVN